MLLQFLVMIHQSVLKKNSEYITLEVARFAGLFYLLQRAAAFGFIGPSPDPVCFDPFCGLFFADYGLLVLLVLKLFLSITSGKMSTP